MTDINFISVAFASAETQESQLAEVSGEEHSGGLSVDPAIVGFQALNFLILLFVLHKILYGPIIKLLNEREKRIRDGVENAVRADEMLRESNQARLDMLKSAKMESQDIVEKARKSGEDVRAKLIQDAEVTSSQIVNAGRNLVEAEKVKISAELKALAVNMVVGATEKLLRQKIDEKQDARLIEESLSKYTA